MLLNAATVLNQQLLNTYYHNCDRPCACLVTNLALILLLLCSQPCSYPAWFLTLGLTLGSVAWFLTPISYPWLQFMFPNFGSNHKAWLPAVLSIRPGHPLLCPLGPSTYTQLLFSSVLPSPTKLTNLYLSLNYNYTKTIIKTLRTEESHGSEGTRTVHFFLAQQLEGTELVESAAPPYKA